MKKFRVTKKSPRLLIGMSLVELVVVLGISSMILMGSFAWFGTKRTSDFADSTRQIESLVREIQSEINTNAVPGYDTSSGSACNQPDRSGCVLKKGEQVLATGIGMQSSGLPATTESRTLQFYYFKVGPLTGNPSVPLAEVSSYATRKIELPVGIHLVWIRVYNRNGTQCGTYWGDIDRIVPNDADTNTLIDKSKTTSVVTFRREPTIMNSFTGTGNLIQAANALPFSSVPNPPFLAGGYSSTINNPRWYDGWGGDNPANFTNGTTALASLPCAVIWRFGSDELTGPTGPSRFTSDILFNFDQQTVRKRS